MMNKEKKAKEELAKMVMEEIGKHPDCADIKSVSIIEVSRGQSYQPNWDVAFVGSGAGLVDPKGTCALLVSRLRNSFDLIVPE
jgi:hypothetical protein